MLVSWTVCLFDFSTGPMLGRRTWEGEDAVPLVRITLCWLDAFECVTSVVLGFVMYPTARHHCLDLSANSGICFTGAGWFKLAGEPLRYNTEHKYRRC